MSSAALKPAACQLRDIYIESGSEVFDLHNDFDFVGFTYDTAERTVSLRWIPNEHTPAEQRRALVLDMGGVSYLSSTPRDADVPFPRIRVCIRWAVFHHRLRHWIALNRTRLPIGTMFFLSCLDSCCALPQSQCV